MVALVENAREALADLCRKYQVSRLDLIGSATRQDFNPAPPPHGSDIDFVVEFADLSHDAANRYLGLMVDLEDLMGRPIDLVSYTGIRNPIFKEMVDRTRVCLYAA